jgi:hypothetical protein
MCSSTVSGALGFFALVTDPLMPHSRTTGVSLTASLLPAVALAFSRGAKPLDAAITRGSKPVDTAIKGNVLMNFLRFMVIPPCGIVVKN